MANSAEVAAVVLEKAAEYIQALEERNKALESFKNGELDSKLTKQAHELAERIQRTTGSEIDLDTLKKVAASEDEAVKSLLEKIAFTDRVEPFGNAREKKGSSLPSTVDKADEAFLNWVLS